MKLTGRRQDGFLKAPPPDIIGVLLFGPDRGRTKSRAEDLARVFLPDGPDDFGATVLTEDDLSADPAKLADEMSALSLLGGGRLVRLKLGHERQAAMITKLLKNLDAEPHKAEAKLIIETGDMTPRSSIRKFCEAAKHFAAIGSYAASTKDLREQVISGLAEKFIGIDDGALEYWLPLLEGDFILAQTEIEKMALYKGYGKEDGAKVTLADVRAVATGGQAASVDAIINDALLGKLEASDSGYRRAVSGKVNPITILIALQRHLLRLSEAAIKMEGGETARGAVKSLRPPVFMMQEQNFLAQLGLWPASALRGSVKRAQEAERLVKSTGAPSEAIISRLLLALAQYAHKRRR